MNAKNKVQPFTYDIDVSSLRKTLTNGKQKMPKDFMADVQMLVPTRQTLQIPPMLHVVVTAHNKRFSSWLGQTREVKSSQHRIFIKCSCGRLIPAGRVRQHRH